MLGCVPGGRLCWAVSQEIGCVGGGRLCWAVSLEVGCVGLCPWR